MMSDNTYKPTFAPWNPQLVEALNFGQQNPKFHPYTCPGNYPECKDQRELVATKDGWVCKCGKYTQNWCHGFSAGIK
jgi:hypothetical protein